MKNYYTLEYQEYRNQQNIIEHFTNKRTCTKRLRKLYNASYEVLQTGLGISDIIDHCPNIENVIPLDTPVLKVIELADDLWQAGAA